jgi:hypothetical protein
MKEEKREERRREIEDGNSIQILFSTVSTLNTNIDLSHPTSHPTEGFRNVIGC